MKKIIAVSLILVMMFATIGFGLAVAKPEEEIENRRYLVKSNNGLLKMIYGVKHNFDSGFTTELSQGQLKILSLFGVETEEVQLYHITAPPGACSPWPECRGEEPVEPVPDCEPTDEIPWGIEMVNGSSGGAGIKVAVLDTGIYYHSDLKDNIVDCRDFTKGPKVRKGCADNVGHGTHVAGTIAANGGSADNLGILGVAPESKIMAYKVCSNSGCWTDDIAAAIDYAGDNGANIISMSFGGPIQSILIKNAIDGNQHVLFVASAGNRGEEGMSYPGANAKVIAVGAIDANKSVAWFSSIGIDDGDDDTIVEKEVEFGAPGVSIESTLNDGCYAIWDGTSMAAPHISGLAAKLWKKNAVDTRNYLRDIAEDIEDDGYDTATGFGLPIAPITYN